MKPPNVGRNAPFDEALRSRVLSIIARILADERIRRKARAAVAKSELLKKLIATGLRFSGPAASIHGCFGDTVWDRETLAEFSCPACGQRVERKLKALRGTPCVLSLLCFQCPGAVVHYTGDPAPANAIEWLTALRQLEATNSQVLILNLNPTTN